MWPWLHEEKLNRIAQWARGGSAPPIAIDFLFSRSCGFHCSFCNVSAAKQECLKPGYEELSRETLLRLADEAAALGVLWWQILGGEPSYHLAKLMDLIQAIAAKGMSGALITNGWGWTPTSLDQLVAARWGKFAVSIYSHEPTVHDALVGVPGAFARATRTIESLAANKKKLGSGEPVLIVNTMINRRNYQTLELILQRFAPLGVTFFAFSPMFGTPPEANKLLLDSACIADLTETILRVKTLAQTLAVETSIGPYSEAELTSKPLIPPTLGTASAAGPFSSIFCYDPWHTLRIDPQGRLACCRGNYDAQPVLTKSGDLERAWYEGHIQQFRQAMAQNRLTPKCSNCCTGIYHENADIRRWLRRQCDR